MIGASSGIGLEIAQGVAEADGEVMLSSRSTEKLNQLASAIGKESLRNNFDIRWLKKPANRSFSQATCKSYSFTDPKQAKVITVDDV